MRREALPHPLTTRSLNLPASLNQLSASLTTAVHSLLTVLLEAAPPVVQENHLSPHPHSALQLFFFSTLSIPISPSAYPLAGKTPNLKTHPLDSCPFPATHGLSANLRVKLPQQLYGCRSHCVSSRPYYSFLSWLHSGSDISRLGNTHPVLTFLNLSAAFAADAGVYLGLQTLCCLSSRDTTLPCLSPTHWLLLVIHFC